jgi:hypothetical protein
MVLNILMKVSTNVNCTLHIGRILGRNWDKVFLLEEEIQKYRNLESENSQDYAQKPLQNCIFMNSA